MLFSAWENIKKIVETLPSLHNEIKQIVGLANKKLKQKKKTKYIN